MRHQDGGRTVAAWSPNPFLRRRTERWRQQITMSGRGLGGGDGGGYGAGGEAIAPPKRRASCDGVVEASGLQWRLREESIKRQPPAAVQRVAAPCFWWERAPHVVQRHVERLDTHGRAESRLSRLERRRVQQRIAQGQRCRLIVVRAHGLQSGRNRHSGFVDNRNMQYGGCIHVAAERTRIRRDGP